MTARFPINSSSPPTFMIRDRQPITEIALRCGAFLGGSWWCMCVRSLIAAQTTAVTFDWTTTFLLVLSLLLGVLTGSLFAYDKRQAQRQQWRVQEFTLHMCTLLGGWSGSFLAQRWLRHKSQKLLFQIMAWLGFGLHLLAFATWWTWG